MDTERRATSRIFNAKELRKIGLTALMLTFGVAGCAQMMPASSAPQQMAEANAPAPSVENCAVVTIGSPSKYACNGKVYTTFDLYKLRTGQK